MNRAERRRSGKPAKAEPAHLYKDADIRRIKQEARDEAIEVAFHLMLAIPAKVLRDKHGFGRVRMERFVNDALDAYDLFQQGYFSLEDFHQILKDECGIEIHKMVGFKNGKG